MVFYFKVSPDAGDCTIFMGFDKHENEELIKYGFLEDIWGGFMEDGMEWKTVVTRRHARPADKQIARNVESRYSSLISHQAFQKQSWQPCSWARMKMAVAVGVAVCRQTVTKRALRSVVGLHSGVAVWFEKIAQKIKKKSRKFRKY